jgi:hypothetical protein
MNKCLGLIGLIGLIFPLPAPAQPAAVPWDVCADTWVATDGLGRSLPTFAEVGPPRADRTVGIFYFLWVNQVITNGGDGMPLDISRMLKENPANPAYGPQHAFHFWGEPELGYYTMEDPYVIRKHLQDLLDAQVDALVCDATNAITYQPVYLKLCETYAAVRKAGGRTPQISFILNSNPADTLKRLHEEFYAKNLYPELWYKWLGKPLLLAPPEAITTDAQKAFYTARHSWAWSDPKGWFKDGKDKWCWVDHYPQKPGWHDAPDKPEQVSVCVAQHPTSNIGRSFHAGKQPPPAEFKTAEGLCFAEQWRRALEVDPRFVFVTGWNEWVAQRFLNGQPHRVSMLGRKLADGETFFVDQYDEEYSRDIEPMKGGYGDAYLYQLIANVRRYKGVRPPPIPRPGRIAIDGNFADWDAVQPEYRDHVGDTFPRDHYGWSKKLPYVNKTGRNDFVRCKVSYDDENVCFCAETAQPITSWKDPHWMMLFIDADQDSKTGWQGYDVLVNGTVKSETVTTVSRSATGGAWTAAGDASYRVSGNKLEVAVPRKLLGLDGGKPVRLDFHWADNIQKDGDITEFAVSGDSAPDRRFNYRYDATVTQAKIDAWAKDAAKARAEWNRQDAKTPRK